MRKRAVIFLFAAVAGSHSPIGAGHDAVPGGARAIGGGV